MFTCRQNFRDERPRLRFAKAAARGVGMSFQITILKVLAGHPEGRASLPDLKRAMAILITRAFSALVESEGDSLAGVNYDSC
jgi:hypothetical protein